ncbi:uncharacterized protein AMSG_02099 [Thecamonas trahens ATCC 50062]|uniref:Katanin p60 ATPase-containing subunit A-like 2 n=1 Tax=Thecamonas trahens ATCC 50062 TaxID=461836 RepID=A0A0L0DVJ4_THETB|nr:hypothetical protein AMSG_02099 [Thecamonas trahens ATCC 50062]KNC56086.1 hypothetical protein AMSG_02099 [Thecamonas trahens ATCC 50062]|eukprot:XP_013761128.1 hypothetical protein AMSG_02099 [Thecamonas trahens ATCC 50062]
MSSLTYRKLKTESSAREEQNRREQSRRKGLLVLMLGYLADQGYTQAAATLEAEAGVDLEAYCPADNIDLYDVIADYEAYYELRFSRKPKLFRRRQGDDPVPSRKAPHRTSSRGPGLSSRKAKSQRAKSASRSYTAPQGMESAAAKAVIDAGNRYAGLPQVQRSSSRASARSSGARPASGPPSRAHTDASAGEGRGRASGSGLGALAVSSSKIEPASRSAALPPQPLPAESGTAAAADTYFANRLLKPLPTEVYGWTSELAELASVITRDIFLENPNVSFDEVCGLESAKRVLREAMIMPLKFPQLFTGILKPWKGLLLFGPPGTGKTMLAKAVATQCKTTFFNISASSIVSKWRGDSEKLVRVLFELAQYHAPSTIFLDEIDAIMSGRGSSGPGGAEHEGSRRLKTELLIQMDGLSPASGVFVLCASNIPWELDPALLRRIEKRILVGLPNEAARATMFADNLPPERGPGLDYVELAAATAGYSGSDIHSVCKEAAMCPLRRLMANIDFDAAADLEVELGPVTMDDARAALASIRPSSSAELSAKLAAWESAHGAS